MSTLRALVQAVRESKGVAHKKDIAIGMFVTCPSQTYSHTALDCTSSESTRKIFGYEIEQDGFGEGAQAL